MGVHKSIHVKKFRSYLQSHKIYSIIYNVINKRNNLLTSTYEYVYQLSNNVRSDFLTKGRKGFGRIEFQRCAPSYIKLFFILLVTKTTRNVPKFRKNNNFEKKCLLIYM